MHRALRSACLLLVLGLAVTGLSVVQVATASADDYSPPPGVRVNNPRGDWAARNRIRRHIIRSIYSVPSYSRIRVWSWNIRDHGLVQALVRVHRYKHVAVQVLMQDDNAYEHAVDTSNPIPAPGDRNDDWFWLRSQLRKYGNSTRPPGYHSFAKLCDASCRGGSGQAHTKMIIFQKVYRSPKVVMYSSGNLTKAAANIQWNDLQTIVGNKTLYDFANYRFGEAVRDRRMANPYKVAKSRGVQLAVFPYYGAGASGDPVLHALRPVHCKYAASGYGTSTGRTKIRVAQTAIGDARGRDVAHRLVQLRSWGCNVRVMYTLMGPRVKGILRAGRVPIHQLAVDTNGDWIYDRYLHQKVLTIDGHYGADRTATLAFNGSANIQAWTLHSDEVFGRNSSLRITRFYERWIDGWFGRQARYAGGSEPLSTRSDDVPERLAREKGIDPYAKFEAN